MRSVLGGMKRIERFIRHNSTLVSDHELQSSFDGFIPRIKSLEKLLFNEADRTHLKELIGSYDLKMLPEQALIGLKVYSDLQNPLLKKYNFDAPDFIVGATEAVIQMQKAMASRNLSNYCNGISSDSTAHDLLKESLSPFIHNAAVSAQQTLYENGNSMVLTNIKINRSAIFSIRTNIFEHEKLKQRREQIEVQRQFMNSQLRALKFEQLKESHEMSNTVNDSINNSTDSVKSFVMPVDSDSLELDEEYVYHEEALIYPDQSVIASVDVVFNSTETYSNTVIDKETGESTHNTPSRTVQSIWTFDGCISSHTPLDWHVVDLDGKCGSANGRFVRESTGVVEEDEKITEVKGTI